jgi:hypothetical protein
MKPRLGISRSRTLLPTRFVSHPVSDWSRGLKLVAIVSAKGATSFLIEPDVRISQGSLGLFGRIVQYGHNLV